MGVLHVPNKIGSYVKTRVPEAETQRVLPRIFQRQAAKQPAAERTRKQTREDGRLGGLTLFGFVSNGEVTEAHALRRKRGRTYLLPRRGRQQGASITLLFGKGINFRGKRFARSTGTSDLLHPRRLKTAEIFPSNRLSCRAPRRTL